MNSMFQIKLTMSESDTKDDLAKVMISVRRTLITNDLLRHTRELWRLRRKCGELLRLERIS